MTKYTEKMSEAAQQAAAKGEYVRPTLRVYGSIASITSAVGGSGNTDNKTAGGKVFRTSA